MREQSKRNRRPSIALVLFLSFSLLVACGTPEVGSVADMSGYEELDEKDTQLFIVSDVRDFLKRLDGGESFAAFFGFTECPWCNDAISLLNSEAESAGQNVYYINTRPNPRVSKNSEIPDYDLLVSRVAEYLGVNDEGEPYLFVPFVFFVREGEIVFTHQGTVSGYDPSGMEMSEEQIQEVRNIYRNGFEMIHP
ncbi:MAG: hypothetical protein J6D46_03445 [Lachnospiraceae bacterium]|nr:hypothetical protein [Lachnospiraceae bacterium]